MMYIFKILIISLFIISCTNNNIEGHRVMSFLYESSFVDHCINISYEDIDKEYTNEEYCDTIFVSDSIFNKLVSIFDLKETKPIKSKIVDCYAAMDYDGNRIYMDYWYNLYNKNMSFVKNDSIRHWRYIIRCFTGYYNDYWNRDLLLTDEDIRNFGIPKNYKPAQLNENVLVKSKGSYRKILFVDNDT